MPQATGATKTVATFIVNAPTRSLPDWTLREAKRTLLNVLGISLSASRYEPAARILEWVRRQGGAGRATLIASGGRTGTYYAALSNGYLAHLEDYDDTHLPTVLHPSAPVWPAVLAVAEDSGASGLDTLAAFAIGAEVACRVAMSTHPKHYDLGWHITGTAGIFGSAAGASRLLGAGVGAVADALGVAGTHASGVREMLGTDAKALHPAHAAAQGVQAAELSAAGFSGPADIFGGRRGFWAVLAPEGHSEEQLTGALGEHWELANNGLKPYANGVVSHPIQDGVIELRNAHSIAPEQVMAIRLRVHPLVEELMGRPAVSRGLEGKFSYRHCAAAALVDGAGHDAQFTDAKVADPDIARLRGIIATQVDEAVAEDQAHVAIDLADGRTVETFVEHATGSPQNPMSDETLQRKFSDLATEVLPSSQANALLEAVWRLDEAPNVDEVMRLTSAAGVQAG